MRYVCVISLELFGVPMGVCRGTDMFFYLYEGAECAVCGVVCDEESHVLVAQFNRSWSVHVGLHDL